MAAEGLDKEIVPPGLPNPRPRDRLRPMIEIGYRGTPGLPHWDRPDEDGWYVQRNGQDEYGPVVRVREAETFARNLRRRHSVRRRGGFVERVYVVTQAGNRFEV